MLLRAEEVMPLELSLKFLSLHWLLPFTRSKPHHSARKRPEVRRVVERLLLCQRGVAEDGSAREAAAAATNARRDGGADGAASASASGCWLLRPLLLF